MFPRLRRSWTDSFITPRSSPLRVPATGSKTEPQIAASKKIRPKKTRMITTVLAKKVSQIKLRPACPARRAAARLRRALVWPILTPPPVRAIQTSTPLGSKDRKRQIVLNCEGNSVYKGRNHWLVFTRPSVAGFDAPIDILKVIRDRGVGPGRGKGDPPDGRKVYIVAISSSPLVIYYDRTDRPDAAAHTGRCRRQTRRSIQ